MQNVVQGVDANSLKEVLLLNAVEMHSDCSFTFLRKSDLSAVSQAHSPLL